MYATFNNFEIKLTKAEAESAIQPGGMGTPITCEFCRAYQKESEVTK
jgi:hypothetical protein